MKHDSVWIATTERRSRAFLTGDLGVDVAVVGAGITGLTTALLTQREGARVAVIEAEHVGAGTTGRTTGKVTSQHGITYSKLLAKHGQERARQYAEANQAAIGQIASLVADLSIDCQFRRGAAYAYAIGPERRGEIEREVEACQRVGLPAVLVTSTDLPYPIAAAVRFDEQAHFHAGRYCAALAERIEAAGGYVFEQTRALAVDSTNDGVTVRTPSGRVRAQTVVLATLLPFAHIGGFFAKARPSRSYGLALRLRTPAPQGMYISIDSPTRSTRPWLDPGTNGLIVVGESHETGYGNDTHRFYRRLEEWATRTFEVEAIDYSWSAQDYITVDGVPYIGQAPGVGRTFVATGFKKWGLTNGTAAAMILADLLAGRESQWLPVFDATRIGGPETVAKLIEQNLQVGKRFVKDRITRLRVPSPQHLRPGEGGKVKVDGNTVGAYRDEDGRVHAVRITCTHMGCSLEWNAAELSWDCPCHGSRFATDGRVLNAPAVEPLRGVEVTNSGF